MTREDFNIYVRQITKRLYSFAFRILKNQVEAEDAVQEVLIRMWKMGKKLDGYYSIDALATTMIKNYSIDQLRKQKHLYRENDIHDDLLSSTPLELMEQTESSNIIQGIIEGMPEVYRNIIILRDIEDLSYEEISKMTGQSTGALRVILSRARAILRIEYKKHFDEKRRVGQITGKVL